MKSLGRTKDAVTGNVDRSHDLGTFFDTNLGQRPRAVAPIPRATTETSSHTLRPGGRGATDGSLRGS